MRSDDPGTTGAVTALLRELVAFPTVSEAPNVELQDWLARRIQERGGGVELVAGAPGRCNLVATIGPDRPGGVMLAGHTDVVPPDSGWAHDPWTIEQVDGRVSGRGTADMKGFFAAVLVALDGIDATALRAPVRVLASFDEEIGCIGVRDVLPVLAADPDVQPDLVVVGEPTSMRPRLSHLGKEAFRVDVTAASAHSSRAATHPSAIAEAALLISVLADIQRSCPPFDGDAAPYSINVGAIAGGTQTNVIAASCRFEFEVRFDVDHRADHLLAPFHDGVDRARGRLAPVGGGVAVERTNSYPALRADATHTAFRDAVRLADRGPAEPLGFGTEAGLIAEALHAPVMICGPGDIAVAHRPNEYVTHDELARCVVFVRQLVDHFCR